MSIEQNHNGKAYRPKVDGVFIGCPEYYGGPPCTRCGGGWPGTFIKGEDIINAAKNGKLNPQKLACGTLQNQGEFLVRKFSPNGK